MVFPLPIFPATPICIFFCLFSFSCGLTANFYMILKSVYGLLPISMSLAWFICAGIVFANLTIFFLFRFFLFKNRNFDFLYSDGLISKLRFAAGLCSIGQKTAALAERHLDIMA